MSLEYYNKNADNFIERTIDLDVSAIADPFLEKVKTGGTILDLGCGSGRDVLYFLDRGYDAHGIDGSEELVKRCKHLLGDRVSQGTFEDYGDMRTYDGIWACASLLHVLDRNMVTIVRKYATMLNDGGIFFMSFKKRPEHIEEDERSFTYYERESLIEMIESVELLEILEVRETASVKPEDLKEWWISAYCRRV